VGRGNTLLVLYVLPDPLPETLFTEKIECLLLNLIAFGMLGGWKGKETVMLFVLAVFVAFALLLDLVRFSNQLPH